MSYFGFAIAAALLAGPSAVPDSLPDEVKLTLIDLSCVQAALDLHDAEHGSYPSTDNELVRMGSVVEQMEELYRSRVPTRDAWKQALMYRSDGRFYVLISKGSDRSLDHDYDAPDPQVTRVTQDNRGKWPDEPAAKIHGPGSDIVVGPRGIIQMPDTQRKLQQRTLMLIRETGLAVRVHTDANGALPVTPGWVFVEDILYEFEPSWIPYIPTTDGWQRPFLIWSNGESYLIVSLGSDGLEDRSYGLLEDPKSEIGRGKIHGVHEDIVFCDGELLRRPD